MGLSPRIVTEDVTLNWDGVSQRLPKGQVIDVAPGSPLERAIGAGRLIPFGTPPPTAAQAAAPAEVAPRQDKPAVPVKPTAAAPVKNAKDGAR